MTAQAITILSWVAPAGIFEGTTTVSSTVKACVSMPGTGSGKGSVGFRPSGVPAYLYLGIADGIPIARVWACRYSKRPPLRGGLFE